MTSPIVIVGAGLAGIAAATRLAFAGKPVVVVESRRRLGGRATSFVDPRDGATLDNCQHVLMGCCTNLLDLYERMGVLDRIEWHRRIFWANPPHEPDVMAPGWLPAPAHFAGSFRKLRFLTDPTKRAIARAMWRMARIGVDGRERWRGRPFTDFMRETSQPDEAIARFWEPILTSACNARLSDLDASYGLVVLQEGFLQDSWSPAMGVPRVPLVELYGRAQGIIESAGGRVRLGVSALGLAFDGKRIASVVTDEGAIDCASVISAVPPDRLAKLCSGTLVSADCRLSKLDAISMSPILGVHLFFDESLMRTAHLVLPGRATHWLFNKGQVEDGRHHIHAVISAADEWMDLPEGEIARRVLDDIWWALPWARGLEPTGVRAVKEKRATFACVPGIDSIRPSAARDAVKGGVENLVLAGDWCATGWPATMEGAVRSGYAAAMALGAPGVVADVPSAPLARLLGL